MKYSKIVVLILIVIFCCFAFSGCSIIETLQNAKEDALITVTLDENGGQIDKKTYKGEAGSTLELPTPTREGFEFYGWCDEYQIYSENVFPNIDVTLVARWIVKEDREARVRVETSLNKSYKISKGYFSYDYDDHKDWKSAIEYVNHNKISPVYLAGVYEAFYNNSQAGIFFGNVGYVKVSGSSSADVLYSQDITNIDGYKQFNFSVRINPSSLVPGNEKNIFMYVLIGSNNSGYDMYVRNISIELVYTEKAGTIV